MKIRLILGLLISLFAITACDKEEILTPTEVDYSNEKIEAVRFIYLNIAARTPDTLVLSPQQIFFSYSVAIGPTATDPITGDYTYNEIKNDTLAAIERVFYDSLMADFDYEYFFSLDKVYYTTSGWDEECIGTNGAEFTFEVITDMRVKSIKFEGRPNRGLDKTTYKFDDVLWRIWYFRLEFRYTLWGYGWG